jgi:pSer/pThr/pTyr-binding forkhead associated (FHA) protein
MIHLRLRALFEAADRGKLFPGGSTLVIGRARDCGLRLNSPLASRHHCEIRVGPSQVVVRDLGSLNGTSVNGAAIAGEQPLSTGDVLSVGLCFFEVLIGHGAGPDSPADELRNWLRRWRRFFPLSGVAAGSDNGPRPAGPST